MRLSTDIAGNHNRINASPLGILLPLLIAALVPISLIVNRWFEPEQIKALLAEEHEEDDELHLLE